MNVSAAADVRPPIFKASHRMQKDLMTKLWTGTVTWVQRGRSELTRLATDVGQTFFVVDARVGALMLLGLAVMSPKAAAFAAIGAVLADRVGRALKPNKKLLISGSLALNGFFAGLAAFSLFDGSGALIALVAGASLTAWIAVLAPRILGQWQLPVLVLPYVLAVWLVWTARLVATVLTPTPFAAPATVVATDFAAQIWIVFKGAGAGMAQVFFQTDWRFGYVMIAVLAACQWRIALWVAMGSLVGSALAAAAGTPLALVVAGSYGFAPALATLGYFACGVAQGARLTTGAKLKAAFAIQILSVALTLGVAPLLYGVGLPALALPYIAVVWAAALLKPEVDGRGWGETGWGGAIGRP